MKTRREPVTVDGRRSSEVDRFRTIAWYEAVLWATFARSPARLDRRFRSPGEGRKRLWQRYRLGRPTPSVSVKGRPGIVAVVGLAYPGTREIFEHPLWDALDPYFTPSVQEVNAFLAKIGGWSSDTFLVETGQMGANRDWEALDAESTWDCPYDESNLLIDLLATFILLFREASSHGRPEIAHLLGLRIRALLHDSRGCRELKRIRPMLTRYVIDRFLGPNYEHLDPSVPHVYSDALE